VAYRRTPRVSARQERTRKTIVEAARALIARNGLAGTSIADVARLAGIGVGTVYRYFPSKADLVGEVVRDVCRRELDIVAEAAAPDRGRPSLRLRDAVTVFAERAIRSGRTAYAMIAEPTDPATEQLRLEIRGQLALILAGIVEDGVRQGEFPDQSPRITGTALVGAVSEVLVGPLSGPAVAGSGMTDTVTEIGHLAVRAVVSDTAVPAREVLR
jgi:AcrR family transcriptional regulator